MIFEEETYSLIGAAFEVYNEPGSAFLEPVYQEAFEFELKLKGIPFEAQKPLKIPYKNTVLEKEFFADLIVFDKIIPREESQLLNYLQASKLKLGLLIHFGSYPKLEHKWIIN